MACYPTVNIIIVLVINFNNFFLLKNFNNCNVENYQYIGNVENSVQDMSSHASYIIAKLSINYSFFFSFLKTTRRIENIQ